MANNRVSVETSQTFKLLTPYCRPSPAQKSSYNQIFQLNNLQKIVGIIFLSILHGNMAGNTEIQFFQKPWSTEVIGSYLPYGSKLDSVKYCCSTYHIWQKQCYQCLWQGTHQFIMESSPKPILTRKPPTGMENCANRSVQFSNENTEQSNEKRHLLRINRHLKNLQAFRISLETMILAFRDFLIDYAYKKGWTNAYFIVPMNAGPKPCEYFKVPLFLSKASLELKCSDERIVKSLLKEQKKQNIIFADFLFPSGDFLNKKCLIDYSPRLKIVFLTAHNASVEGIVGGIQPKTLTNYKWTLGKLLMESSNPSIALYKIYGLATSEIPLPQWIGRWDKEKGLYIDPSRNARITSFQGRTLRITAINTPPISYLTRTPLSSSGNESLVASGYLPDLLDILSAVLDFKSSILTPLDGKFGNKEESGNWTGMVGMLQFKEADIAISSFSYTVTRKLTMDFSPPVEYSSTRLLIRRDWKPAELKLDAFLRPFEWNVWLAIGMLIIIGTITLMVFTSFKLFYATPIESFWILSTCFLLQGQDEHLTIQAAPFRITSGTFWLLSVFIFACYTARLTSFLAGDADKLPVKDLDEAVKSGSWKIGFTRGSPYIEKVKESKAPEMILLGKRLQGDPSVLVSGFQEGLVKVFTSRYIYFTSELIPTFMVKGNCSYSWLPAKYFPGFGYMGYQKGLPYASTLSHMVSKVRETGLMKRNFKKWWGTTSSCAGSHSGSDAFTTISLLDAGSAFIILIFGACLALLIGVLEYLLTIRKDNWQDKDSLHQSGNTDVIIPVAQNSVVNIFPVPRIDRQIIWTIRRPSLG